VAGARAENRDHAGEIGSERIALGELDARELSGFQAVHVVLARYGVPANARTGGHQHAQLGARQLAGADEGHQAALQIEEDRQIAHSNSPSPTSGLTEIIFSLSVLQPSQRENYFFSIAHRRWNFRLSRPRSTRCLFSPTKPPTTGCVPARSSKH